MIGGKDVRTIRRDLKLAPVDRPKGAGVRWKGTPHIEMVEALDVMLERKSWKMADLRYVLTRGAADITFSCVMDTPTLKTINVEVPSQVYKPSFGFVASNARRRRLYFYCGVAGDKGSFVGSRWEGHSYTSNFDPHKQMHEAVETWLDEYLKLYQHIDYLRGTTMSKDDVEEMLLAAGRGGLLPWSRIGKVCDAVVNKRRVNTFSLICAYSKWCHVGPAPEQMDSLYNFAQLLWKGIAKNRNS